MAKRLVAKESTFQEEILQFNEKKLILQKNRKKRR
jgi:hypothetical protein